MHCAVNIVYGEIIVKEIHIVSVFMGLRVYWGIKIVKQAIATHSDKGCQQEVKNAIEGFLERVTFQPVQKHPSALGAPGLLLWGRCQRRG